MPYKNSAIGINNLFYPSDWKKSESKNKISFNPPVEAINNNTNSVLQVQMVPTRGNLDYFVGDHINGDKQNTTGFELTNSILTNVNGHRAYEIEYTYKDVKFQKQYKGIEFCTYSRSSWIYHFLY